MVPIRAPNLLQASLKHSMWQDSESYKRRFNFPSVELVFGYEISYFTQARERMRQKFGASNGLSAGGKMAGIGSNPNYNADQQSQSSSLDLGEASQRAYSLFSTSIAMLGETVSKVSAMLIPNPSIFNL